MEKIILPGAPAPIGPYTPAMKANGFVYTSGQIGKGEITEAAHMACKAVKALLEAAGTDCQHVVKTTCFLADMNDFAAFNTVYAEYFTEKPARSCFAVKDLPGGAVVEVEAIAEL